MPSAFLVLAFIASSTLCAALGQATPSEKGQPDAGMQMALGFQKVFSRIAARVAPSVVTVTAHVRDGSTANTPEKDKAIGAWVKDLFSDEYPGYRAIKSGSGFMVSKDGDVLTCRTNVLTKDGKIADLIDVETSDTRNTICRVVATEPTLNLALLRLEVYNKKFPPRFRVAEFGNSAAMLPGHWSFAAGDPNGPEVFFRPGVICSPPSRECYQEQLTSTYLQAALTVHPEAYGGPLVDLQGKVVAMLVPRLAEASQIFGRPPGTMGIEFGLPSNIMTGIYQALKKKKSLKSPWLGIAVMSRPEILKDRGPEAFKAMQKPKIGGILIENVFGPSPAHAAGIKPGDFLVKFDGHLVTDPLTFQKFLYLSGIGAEVSLEFFRKGEIIATKMKVLERPENAITR